MKNSYDPIHYLPLPHELSLKTDSPTNGLDRTNFLYRVLTHVETQPVRWDHVLAQPIRWDDDPQLTYYEALGYLVHTYSETRQEAIWAKYEHTLPTTKGSLSDATADALRVATLAVYGLARAKAEDHDPNASADVWIKAASEAVDLYNAFNPIMAAA